jgi:CelD/BcsL family acetyltransferase involved in cellulose biosynthesis
MSLQEWGKTEVKNNAVDIQDDIGSLTAEWERLAQQTKSSPFLWPGWISAWWNAFGTGQLRILAAYENGCLVGILPLRRFRGVLSSTTNSETFLFGLLAANEAAAKQLSQALFSQRARRIDLSYLDSTDASVSVVRATASTLGYRVTSSSMQGSPYVTISETTWEAYEKGLDRKLRSELRRRRRRLEEEGRLTLEVFDGKERLEELLEEGFRVEGSGWKDAAGTSIDTRQAARRFYTEIGRWAAKRGWLRLAFLQLDGRTLAFDYCLEYNKVHYLIKTGYDPSYRSFAPGMIIRYLMINRAFSEGLALYDFLGVDAPWKRQWTNAFKELQFLRMFAPTTLGSLDRAVFVSGRSAIEFAKSTIQSSIFPERGRRLLKHAHATWRHKIDRRRTS